MDASAVPQKRKIQRKPWTPEEEAFLQQQLQENPQQLPIMPGRTAIAVREKIKKLRSVAHPTPKVSVSTIKEKGRLFSFFNTIKNTKN
jgi:hypothetical protein